MKHLPIPQRVFILGAVLTLSLLFSTQAHSQCATNIPSNALMIKPKNANGSTSFGLSGYKELKWNKSTLRVQFIGGTAQQKEFVRKHALTWAKKTNVKLQFHTQKLPDIRVSFRSGEDFRGNQYGSYSALGTYAKKIITGGTMNFAWLDRRTVLHEFGHALGFSHEHLRPDLDIQWNEAVVLAYTKDNYGWDEAKTRSNIFTPTSLSKMFYSKPDTQSIMTYPVLQGWTKNDFEIPVISELSPTDIALTNRVYKKSTDPWACDNYEPAILTDEFTEANIDSIESWRHHCNPAFNLEAFATDIKGRKVWRFYDRSKPKGQQPTSEWVEKYRRYKKGRGVTIVLLPSGTKTKKDYITPMPGFGTKLHQMVLTQGDGNLEIYYRKNNGSIVAPEDQFIRLGQGKFYDH